MTETKVKEQPIGDRYRAALVILIMSSEKTVPDAKDREKYLEWLLNKPKKDIIQFAAMLPA